MLLSVFLSSSAFANNVSAYIYANYKNSESVYDILKSKGFDILGEYDLMNNEKNHIIVYTNSALEDISSRRNRGFAAVQKVLVSKEDHKLVFTNPEYFLCAFLQDRYDNTVAKRVLASYASGFGKLNYSASSLEESTIKEYHFLMGMPYYLDMIEVARGNNLLEILEKNAKDNVVFTLSLGDSTLVGVAMPDDKEYLSKIKGEKHAAFLPYMVLIEDNVAKILHPKYYIAIAYPNLTMREFINISDTPDDIEEYFKALLH